MNRLIRYTLPLLTLVLLLASCGLGSEPQIVSTLPPATSAVTDIGFPQSPPDLALGASLFAENCTRCHGSGGAGDGALVLSGEVGAIRSFLEPEAASSQTPRQWFDVITNGRLEKLMPPWKGSLNERERWAVAYYTYTLHYTEAMLTRGEALAAEQNVTNNLPLAQQVTLTDAALFAQLMPDTTLPAEDQAALAAYLRSQSLANSDTAGQQVVAPASTEEAVIPVDTPLGTVTGTVTNGTAASTVPEDFTVRLNVFDSAFNVEQTDVTVNPDGTFTFADVPMMADRGYQVTAFYRDRVFNSIAIGGDPSVTTLDLPLTIYELTEDPAVISIKNTVFQVNAVGDALQIVQAVNFNNSSDRAFSTSTAAEDGRFPSVFIPLPPGSVVFETNSSRFITAPDGLTVIDTAAVMPGEDHIVLVSYLIPYTNGAIIEQPINYPLNGSVRLLLRPETLIVEGDAFEALGTQQVGQSTYEGYTTEVALEPGGVIRFSLSGATTAAASGTTTSASSPVITSDLLLPLIIGAIAVAVVIIVIIILRKPTTPQVNSQPLVDALVRQIAELDDQHQAGVIVEDIYQNQRAQLKARLAQLLNEKKP